MQKRLLILGASRYYQSTILHLTSLGYETFVIDKQENSPGFASAVYSEAIDFGNKELTLEFAKKHQIHGIMPLNDYGVQTAAFINQKLGLYGVYPEAADCVSDKAKMRSRWKEHGLLSPTFFIASTISEAFQNIKDSHLTYPLIIKPTDSRGGGSRGVQVITQESEVVDAITFAQSFYEKKSFIIEEFVTGTEHSIEVLISRSKMVILGISLKSKLPYPYRVDKQVIYPAPLIDAEMQQIKKTIQQAIEAIDLKDGVAHVELALTKKGPMLFEIGIRPGGGATPIIINKVYNVDYLSSYARIICGENIEFQNSLTQQKAAIYHFFALPPGLTRQNKLIEMNDFSYNHAIQDIEIFTRPGDTTKPVRIGPDRHGFAFIMGQNLDQVKKIAHALDDYIQENFYE